MLTIPVILGSVRNERWSVYPARFMVKKLQEAGYESQLVDFKELPLPFMDSAVEPSKLNKQYPYPNVQAWSNIAQKADGFIIVTPEYNHGVPGVLKNAFDWLYPEFNNKPVGLVGVSNGRIGAARVVEQLRPLMANFAMYDIRETVLFGPVAEAFNQQSELINLTYVKAIDGLIKNLIGAAEAMKK